MSIIVVLLGIISLSAVVTALGVVIAARDLRRTLRRVNRMLPACEEAIREVHQTFEVAHKILTRTQHAASHVETTIERACVSAMGLIERMVSWPSRARVFLKDQFGNGARSGPRQR
jgi:hypothetical protein